MTSDEILAQVLDLLQRYGRVFSRPLNIRVDLDDLERLRTERIHWDEAA
jgi:hypothetical protein